MWTDRQTNKRNGQMNGQNYTNFKTDKRTDKITPISNGLSVFELESGNKNVHGRTNEMDKQTDKITPISKPTKERTKLHQFRMEPSYDDDLSPCQVGIRLDKLFSS